MPSTLVEAGSLYLPTAYPSVSAFHMAGEVLGLQVNGGGHGAVVMVAVVLVVLMVVEAMVGRRNTLERWTEDAAGERSRRVLTVHL